MQVRSSPPHCEPRARPSRRCCPPRVSLSLYTSERSRPQGCSDTSSGQGQLSPRPPWEQTLYRGRTPSRRERPGPARHAQSVRDHRLRPVSRAPVSSAHPTCSEPSNSCCASLAIPLPKKNPPAAQGHPCPGVSPPECWIFV